MTASIEIERFIRVQAKKVGKGESAAWRNVPNADRLRVWGMSSSDLPEGEVEGGRPTKRMHFHVSFVDGLKRGCRVTYMGVHFSVLGVSDSTRVRGLELQCAPES